MFVFILFFLWKIKIYYTNLYCLLEISNKLKQPAYLSFFRNCPWNQRGWSWLSLLATASLSSACQYSSSSSWNRSKYKTILHVLFIHRCAYNHYRSAIIRNKRGQVWLSPSFNQEIMLSPDSSISWKLWTACDAFSTFKLPKNKKQKTVLHFGKKLSPRVGALPVGSCISITAR